MRVATLPTKSPRAPNLENPLKKMRQWRVAIDFFFFFLKKGREDEGRHGLWLDVLQFLEKIFNMKLDPIFFFLNFIFYVFSCFFLTKRSEVGYGCQHFKPQVRKMTYFKLRVGKVKHGQTTWGGFTVIIP